MANKNKGDIKKELPGIILELSKIRNYVGSLEKNPFLHVEMDEKYLVPAEEKLQQALELINEFRLNMK